MGEVTGKREVVTLDGTPDKRMFWSIISDYDVQTALCELIDNAIDQWMGTKLRAPLAVELVLDADRQLISVEDNAGGIGKSDLRMLIAPGSSRNDPSAATIGIFGVGSKRAVVALAENVVIKTHRKGDSTFQIDVTSDWLESPNWDIPAYEIPSIPAGVTSIDLLALRKTFSDSDVQSLKRHLGETYAWFLKQKDCSISVNGDVIKAIGFETWAYPPSFEPQRAIFDVDLSGSGKIKVDMTVGLIRDRDPEADNYGVYFYCNHRLIVKELKVREVGYFVTSEAGVPHPDASLCRAIIRLDGEARLMPWNSSKTGINYSHPLFHAIRPGLLQLVTQFSSLSRRLKDDWEEKVFKFTKGAVQQADETAVAQGKKLVLPPLPKVNKPHVESLKARNEGKIADQPWTLGLVEAVAAVTILNRQKLETKNRISLILLDSSFEIALKEFVVHRTDLFPPKQFSDTKIKQLFERRNDVITAVTSKVNIPKKLLDKAKHYYGLRNKLIHERATVDVTDSDVENYDSTIREMLHILFGLDL
ncbi:histidine kinase [Sulfuricaulis limicola]|uniref:Histidine kinase n=1 Tax=Sulfuricaulis limicola TaxID=1620215 RepID=A0A1B4XF24_9GAMM|nr:ATP-binding protein [Sulfuricaulis limicola]BAV33400.1 histidine kinase [Sulfuricaulis limicola]